MSLETLHEVQALTHEEKMILTLELLEKPTIIPLDCWKQNPGGA